MRAHGSDARYLEPVPWTKPRFTRVLASNRSELGLNFRNQFEMRTIDGRSCVAANLVAFDVDDKYAFDVDESVDVTVTYAPEATTPFTVGWDKNGGDGFAVSAEIKPEPGPGLRRATVTLERARLAGLGVQKTDFAVGGRGGVTICDIDVSRSGSTKAGDAFGRLRLDVRDAKSGRPVAARIGLYDATGRAPLPSDQSILVHRFADEIRLLWVNRRTTWPSPNRLAFYVNGSYEARLPVGMYELVATRGPEYKVYRGTVEVKKEGTTAFTLPLERYADLPSRGWYSGDSHVHLARDRVDDISVWAQLAGEDVHVGNLLEMGNISRTHFKQPAWGKAGRFARDGTILVSGQEDPRTGQRGHTIHWNLSRHFHREPESYFLYHEVFEESRRQGGISGYAHLGELFNGRRGLALDVPFGIVDFIEVLQGGRLFSDIWYSFLNLGFKLRPVGGADFPYFGPTLPGVERTYVKVDGPFTADSWFAAAKRGHMYVSNGPLLEFTVNGRQMGEELRVARGTKLEIVADAELNPDIDKLGSLDLIVHGDAVTSEAANGRDRVRLRTELTADRSMWIAARALGERAGPQNMIVAHSAPIYVIVDDQPFWKISAVPELIASQRAQLEQLMTVPIEPNQDLEPWETRTLLVKEWERQKALLKPRVDEADARYRALLDRVQQSSAPRIEALPCGDAVAERLKMWRATPGARVVPPQHALERARYMVPTDRLGVWLDLRVSGAGEVSLVRVDAEGTSEVAWNAACQSTERTSTTPPRWGQGGPSRKWSAFTDRDLERIVTEEPRVVFYLWSPHMPLSVDGVRQIELAAKRLDFHVVPLADPAADSAFVASTARESGLSDEATRPARSIELMFRDATLHAPSILPFVNGRPAGAAVPGYHDADGYTRLLRDRVESPDYCRIVSDGAKVEIVRPAPGEPAIDDVNWFARPVPNPRGDWIIGFASHNLNYLYNLTTGRRIRIPDKSDAVATPDGKYMTVPSHYTAANTVNFYDLPTLLARLAEGKDATDVPPVFAHADANVHDVYYQSIGVVSNRRTNDSETTVYRMMFSGTRQRPMPGFRIVDYTFTKTRSGPPEGGPRGGGIKVQASAAMRLCPEIVKDMATPFISKDGRYVVAHDDGKPGQEPSLKIFEITGVDPANQTTSCRQAVDFKFRAGKADFSFDGSRLTFHTATYDYITAFVDGGLKTPTMTDVVVVDLERGPGNSIVGYRQLARITTTQTTGVGSYFPAFFPDGRLFYVFNEAPKDSTGAKSFRFKVVDPARDLRMANIFANDAHLSLASTIGDLWRATCAPTLPAFKPHEAAWYFMSLSPDQCRRLVEHEWRQPDPAKAALLAACKES